MSHSRSQVGSNLQPFASNGNLRATHSTTELGIELYVLNYYIFRGWIFIRNRVLYDRIGTCVSGRNVLDSRVPQDFILRSIF